MPRPRFEPDDRELLAFGADLAPGTVLSAYRQGIFPMNVAVPAEYSGTGAELDGIGWWSPNPRAVLRPQWFHLSRSLARSLRGFQITFDRDFPAVVAGCADPGREHGWIDADFVAMYAELHSLGWAHSVEVWSAPAGGDPDQRPVLAGGLFGIELGGLFCAESKFHRQTDASKAAVAALCARLAGTVSGESRLIDVQWATPHLRTLGVREWSRRDYLAQLPRVLALPPVLGRESRQPDPIADSS